MNSAKKKLRQIIYERLKKLDPQIKDQWGSAILESLQALELWQKADVVLLYLAMANEINTQPIIELAYSQNKKVAVPMLSKGHMEFRYFTAKTPLYAHSPFGILQPGLESPCFDPAALKPEENCLVIVPGLAFYHDGRRLGRGGGYYDRFLASIESYERPRFFALALAYQLQLHEAIPFNEHDRRVDGVLTEKGFDSQGAFRTAVSSES
ncbi:MAG: 5-formyltetrahydrofolate cyclo-ligase [Spirochaetales bacterium]|nr:5-formyltetrahydrofolate cyclo-ligase [Spirochaetales bacterium]